MPPLVLASLPPPGLLKDSETTKDFYHPRIHPCCNNQSQSPGLNQQCTNQGLAQPLVEVR